MKKEQKSFQKEGQNMNAYKLMALTIFTLVILLPIATSYLIAQTDSSQDALETKTSEITKITGFAVDDTDDETTDVGQQCSNKEDDISSFVEIMDNGVIATLEKVASVMFLITTVASAIDMIINSVYNALGCCGAGHLIPGLNIACAYKEGEGKVWSNYFSNVVKPLACFVNCGWCTGEGDCSGLSSEFGLGDSFFSSLSGTIDDAAILRSSSEGGIGIGPKGGIGQYHLSPYDNIYIAVGCMCPVAILFNLRKLKTIYQVNDCCVQQACENGQSTEMCDKQLAEATCMYWQGSLFQTAVKVIMSFITDFIGQQIINLIGEDLLKRQPIYCVLALWNLAKIPATIEGIKSSSKWMKESFKDPSCEDLGFDRIQDAQKQGLFSQSEGVKAITLNDRDGDGRYDGLNTNYDSKSIKLTSLSPELITGLGGEEALKDKSLRQYTMETVEGPKTYIRVADRHSFQSIIGTEDRGIVYYELTGAETNDEKQLMGDLGSAINSVDFDNRRENSVASFENARIFSNNEIKYDGQFYQYEISGGEIILTDSRGEITTRSLSGLVGKNIILSGKEIKIESVDGDTLVLDDESTIEFGEKNALGAQPITTTTKDGQSSTTYSYDDGTSAMEIEGGPGGYLVNGVQVEGATQENIPAIANMLVSEDLDGATDIQYNVNELVYTREDGHEISVQTTRDWRTNPQAGDVIENDFAFNPTRYKITKVENGVVYYTTYTRPEEYSGAIIVMAEIMGDDGYLDADPTMSLNTIETDSQMDLNTWNSNVMGYVNDATLKLTTSSDGTHLTSGEPLLTRTETYGDNSLSTVTNLNTGLSTVTFAREGEESIEMSSEVAALIPLGEITNIEGGTITYGGGLTVERLDRLMQTPMPGDPPTRFDSTFTINIKSVGGVVLESIETSTGQNNMRTVHRTHGTSGQTLSSITTDTFGTGANKLIVVQTQGANPSIEDIITMQLAGEKTIETTNKELIEAGLLGNNLNVLNTARAIYALGGDVSKIKYDATNDEYYTGEDYFEESPGEWGVIDGQIFSIDNSGRQRVETFNDAATLVEITLTSNNAIITQRNVNNDQGERTSWTQEWKDPETNKILKKVISLDGSGISDVDINYLDDQIEIQTIDKTTGLVKETYTYDHLTGKFKNSDGEEVDLDAENFHKETRELLEAAEEAIEDDTDENLEQFYKDKEKISRWHIYREISAAEAQANREAVIYDMTYQLLDNTLGKFAYDKISDFCSED
jgi:hypothetical protein